MPLILTAVPQGFFEGAGIHSETDADTIVGAVERMYRHALPAARDKWKNRLARIPLTTDEFKKHMKRKYLTSERAAIGLLAAQESMASTIFCQLRLSRASVKEVLRRLQGSRKQQVVFAGICCATRFKYYGKNGKLLPVACARGCGSEETLDHILECNHLSIPKDEDDTETWLTFLKRLARKASAGTVAIPVPLIREAVDSEDDMEISLEDGTWMEEYLQAEAEDSDSLGFEEG